MRLFLAGLFLLAAPGIASARCACTCVMGKPVAVCPSSAMAEPICPALCTDRVDQTLKVPSVAAPNVATTLSVAPSAGSQLDKALQSGDLQGLEQLLGR